MTTSIMLYSEKKKQFNEKLVERLAKQRKLEDLKNQLQRLEVEHV
jgi:hypothetical protein